VGIASLGDRKKERESGNLLCITEKKSVEKIPPQAYEFSMDIPSRRAKRARESSGKKQGGPGRARDGESRKESGEGVGASVVRTEVGLDTTVIVSELDTLLREGRESRTRLKTVSRSEA